MRNYLKKNQKRVEESVLNEEELQIVSSSGKSNKKSTIVVLAALGVVLPLAFALVTRNELESIPAVSEGDIELSSSTLAATSTKKGVISIPSGMVKANPFLPYRDLKETAPVSDVPEFSLVEPPEMLNGNSDAARVMDTIVSGILYDKFSPSAILNIEGNDYLVKKGDVVNNYKVLSIMQDSVTVKLGDNTYKAGIGEILTEGTLNHNDVSNLNNKFGGVQ